MRMKCILNVKHCCTNCMLKWHYTGYVETWDNYPTIISYFVIFSRKYVRFFLSQSGHNLITRGKCLPSKFGILAQGGIILSLSPCVTLRRSPLHTDKSICHSIWYSLSETSVNISFVFADRLTGFALGCVTAVRAEHLDQLDEENMTLFH